MDQAESILLGVFEISEAKSIKRELSERGIKTDLAANDQTCTKGCKVTVELWGHKSDEEQLIAYFHSMQKKNFEGLEINIDHINQVFDENAKEVICQACGAKFSPTCKECPDCGLVYF